jgi:hypothetical protein
MRLAVLLAACLALPVHADLIAKNPKAELRLVSRACTNAGILERIKEERRGDFRAGHLRSNDGGLSMSVCWADTGEGYYFIVFADGDATVAPIQVFTEEPGA